MRDEAWRHTDINRWYASVATSGQTSPQPLRRDFVQAPDNVVMAAFDDADASELAAPNRHRSYSLRDHPLAAVNALRLDGGVVLVVPRGVEIADPIRLTESSVPAPFQHVVVLIEAGASATLVEEAAHFSHRVVEISVAANARLRHFRRQGRVDEPECNLVWVHVDRDARYDLAQSSHGSPLRRNDIGIDLVGAGAEARVNGIWRVVGGDHLANQVCVQHSVARAFSRQEYRGVVRDRSRAVLNGRIHIRPAAAGADAALGCKNLLATDDAEVFAKPELEIYDSDVKCSHGVTVGTLDEDALFLLRSRGLNEDSAKALLVRAFLREAMADEEGATRLGLLA